MRTRRTLAAAVALRGVGVHSGAPCAADVAPAAFGAGITLRADDAVVPLTIASACPDAAGATVIAVGERRVGMVEHLLAALVGAGVTDAAIRVDGPEVPILDGSARPWCAALRDAGLADGPQGPELVLLREVAVTAHGGEARALPADGPEVAVEVDFGAPPLPRGRAEVRPGDLDGFEAAAGFARTFALARDVARLVASGRGRGANLDNTVVYGDGGVENPGGARSDDEGVRHKLLDAVGDLALLGAPLRGRVEVRRGGHALHHALVRAILADRAAWTLG